MGIVLKGQPLTATLQVSSVTQLRSRPDEPFEIRQGRKKDFTVRPRDMQVIISQTGQKLWRSRVAVHRQSTMGKSLSKHNVFSYKVVKTLDCYNCSEMCPVQNSLRDDLYM